MLYEEAEEKARTGHGNFGQTRSRLLRWSGGSDENNGVLNVGASIPYRSTDDLHTISVDAKNAL